jgi:hypothetical protein
MNIGNRKDVRTVDIIGFLEANNVKLRPLANNYKNIMTTDHTSPIIIEYSVMRHSFESTDLPPSWIQFCILFQKEKLLVPFNQKGDAISLGNQFNEQKWTHNFTHYVNSFQAIAPLTAHGKGVHFFQGHISLKNGTFCPLFSHDSSSFKDTCLLIK